MPITIDELIVELRTEISDLKRGMDEANRVTAKGAKGVEKSVKAATNSFIQWQVAIRGARVAWKALTSELASIDALAKQSDAIGISTKALSALQFAGKLAGVEIARLGTSLGFMTRNIGEASRGSGEAADALEELGLNAQELIHLSPDQVFAKIAESITEVDTAAEQASIAMDIFGRGGLSVINLLRGGKESIDAARKATEEYGTALSRIDARQIEQVNDAITEMKESWKGTFREVVTAVGPGLIRTIDFITDSVTYLQLAWENVKHAILVLEGGVIGLAQTFEEELLSAINAVIKGIDFLIEEWNAVAGTIIGDIAVIEKIGEIDLSSLSGSLRASAAATKKATQDTVDEINNIEEELARRRTERKNRRIKELIETAKREIALNAGSGAGRPNKVSAEEEAKAKKEFADVAKQLLLDELSAEEAAIFESLDKRLALFMEAHEKGLLTDEEFFQREKDAYAAKESAITGIKMDEEARRKAMSLSNTRFLISQIRTITEAVGEGSRQQFEAMKVVKIAEVGVNTAAAVMKIWAEAPIGLRPGLTAAAVAAGVAQVANIASTSPGSGGTIGGGGAGGSIAAPEVVQDVNVILQGDTFSDSTVRRFGNRLGEILQDGGTIRGLTVQ